MRYPHPVSVEARVLEALVRSEGTALAITAHIGATSPGVYSALRRLEQGGKVRRVYDGRAAVYSLTSAGKRAAANERKLVLGVYGVAA